MKTLLFSFSDSDGRRYSFDVRADKRLAEKIEVAADAGAEFKFDGVLYSRHPAWSAGTPIAPVFRFFSRIWNT